MNPMKSSRVHRYRDLVALDLADVDNASTKTMYLTEEHAGVLGAILQRFAEDVRHFKFSDSREGTDGFDEDDARITNAQAARYLKNRGGSCPRCGGTEFSGGRITMDMGTAYQDLKCCACGIGWTDCYELDRILDVDVEHDHGGGS